MHGIEVDPATGLVEIAVEGFSDAADAGDFARDLDVATMRARSRG